MQVQGLRKILIRRVGNRVSLVLGGDREMVMFSGLLAFALIFSAQTWYSIIVGLFIWFICLFFLRKAAKSDPLLRYVYLRSLRYKIYYDAFSTPFRVNKRERK